MRQNGRLARIRTYGDSSFRLPMGPVASGSAGEGGSPRLFHVKRSRQSEIKALLQL
jgi:hypothetical protein